MKVRVVMKIETILASSETENIIRNIYQRNHLIQPLMEKS